VKKGKIYIGTSGWSYKHWEGTFYPAGTKSNDQFKRYSDFFQTVEINNSFYKLPSPLTFLTWKKSSKPGFIFSVKASRFITHMKKLNMGKVELRKFFKSVSKLGNKLGAILFQLPPKWKLNVERLEKFLSALPTGFLYAFEFRNNSWYNKAIYDLLADYNCAFCIYELEGHTSPMMLTASFIYIRLHGPGGKYQGNYTDTSLKCWADKCKKWREIGKTVYIYFDNDQLGYAALNAVRLRQLVEK
jgi:uncharacterized protein YecE (DUF72 family)